VPTILDAKARLICAIDTDDLAFATKLAQTLKGHIGAFKLGLEFFTGNGPQGVEKIKALGMPILLDLKLHDIPNTVAGAMKCATRMGVEMITIHTGGSSEMMRAAVKAAEDTAKAEKVQKPKIFGVTVLTSLDDDDLTEVGFKQKIPERVKRLAEMAQLCGLDGVVASARELAILQEQRGKEFMVITPGIRPAWSADAGDQKRVLAPADAIKAGADYLVVGRPITKAANQAEAADKIVAEIASALKA
jgi:orotidine-5'-phosphate decarboxylase